MENKLIKLTSEEKSTFLAFIGTAVLENIAFPGHTVGITKITIQELLNNYSISSIEEYGSFIHKAFNAEDDVFKKNRSPKKFGSLTVQEFINFLLLTIKYKNYIEQKSRWEKQVRKLKSELDKHKTPDQIKSDLEKELSEAESFLNEE